MEVVAAALVFRLAAVMQPHHRGIAHRRGSRGIAQNITEESSGTAAANLGFREADPCCTWSSPCATMDSALPPERGHRLDLTSLTWIQRCRPQIAADERDEHVCVLREHGGMDGGRKKGGLGSGRIRLMCCYCS